MAILTSMITLKGVSKAYGGGNVIESVSLTIAPGECVCITGPSGAGKTVLLSLLIGAERPSGGMIMIDDVDLNAIPPLALQLFRRRVGIVYQDRKLFPERTVTENVALSLEIAGESGDVIARRVGELLARMGLTGKRDTLPRALSAAEATLVALVRAVAHRPLILLADEPLDELDDTQRATALGMIGELHAAGSSVILAVRDATTAAPLRPRVIELRRGRVVGDTLRKKVTAEGSIPTAPVRDSGRTREIDMKTIAHEASERALKKRKVKVTAIHSE